MLTPEEDELSARIHAVAHVLKALTAQIEAIEPGIIGSIASTIEDAAAKILNGADDDDAVRWTEAFRLQVLAVLEHETIRLHLEDGGLPRPSR